VRVKELRDSLYRVGIHDDWDILLADEDGVKPIQSMTAFPNARMLLVSHLNPEQVAKRIEELKNEQAQPKIIQ
jgi:hypothetical protein